jgi:hypothetical protein
MAEMTTMKADPYSWPTREERKRLAERLYGDGWTMERIAEALKVSQPTITRDLAQFIPTNKPARAKGGRPKGSEPAPVAEDDLLEIEQPALVAVRQSDQQTKLAEMQEDDLPKERERGDEQPSLVQILAEFMHPDDPAEQQRSVQVIVAHPERARELMKLYRFRFDRWQYLVDTHAGAIIQDAYRQSGRKMSVKELVVYFNDPLDVLGENVHARWRAACDE